MAFDAHKNAAYSTVATAPSPATSGTTLVVASGDGTKFPTPPFNAVVWPAGAQPLITNFEIVRVTNISTDTLTITRGATSGGGLNGEPNNANRSIIIGDQIDAGLTARSMTDIETDLFNAYKFSAYLTSTQTVSAGVWTKIGTTVGYTKNFDTGSNFDAGTNMRFTAPVAGFYWFHGAIGNNGNGTLQAALYKNGSALRYGVNVNPTTNLSNVDVTDILQLAANDYVELWGDSGTNTTIVGGATGPSYFSAFLVSLT